MCLRMKIIDIILKFATNAEYLQELVTNSERSQVILHLLTNIDQFRKRFLMLLSHIGEYASEYSEYVSL